MILNSHSIISLKEENFIKKYFLLFILFLFIIGCQNPELDLDKEKTQISDEIKIETIDEEETDVTDEETIEEEDKCNYKTGILEIQIVSFSQQKAVDSTTITVVNYKLQNIDLKVFKKLFNEEIFNIIWYPDENPLIQKELKSGEYKLEITKIYKSDEGKEKNKNEKINFIIKKRQKTIIEIATVYSKSKMNKEYEIIDFLKIKKWDKKLILTDFIENNILIKLVRIIIKITHSYLLYYILE